MAGLMRALGENDSLWEQIPRGPEGRPLNVSPARKGWVGIPITILSARGAAPILSSTNLRREGIGDVSRFVVGPREKHPFLRGTLLKQLTRSELADEDAIGGQKVIAG
jgi:hypothetical protein